jgi:hypothetical protein
MVGGPVCWCAHGAAAALVLFMAAVEVSVPVWAERGRNTAWHPQHIAERYGLFTLIVLGETVLSSTAAVQRGLAGGTGALPLLGLRVCGLVIVFGMWWVYFGQRAERFLRVQPAGVPLGLRPLPDLLVGRRGGAGMAWRSTTPATWATPQSHRGRGRRSRSGGRVPVRRVAAACPSAASVRAASLAMRDRRAHPARGTDPVGAAADALVVAALVATSVVADARPRHSPTPR